MATVILKVTERCNSNCYYCDVVRKAKTGQTMPLDLLEVVAQRVGDHLRAEPGERVHLIWHGGEPLLLGPDYYAEAAELFARHCQGALPRLTHSIQSNLTALTEEHLEPLARLGIRSFGTSFDPEPHMRGPGAGQDSDAYNRRFLEGVSLLRRKGIGWGVIYVVTRRSLARPLDVFHFLVNLAPRGGVSMNPVLIYDQERKDVAITPEEYRDFLGAIFPLWWAKRHRYPGVQPFSSLVSTIVEGRTHLFCSESGTCTYHQVNVTPDGETSQCGRSADWDLLPYGNIRDRTLAEILAHPHRDPLAQRVRLLAEGECAGCRLWEICHGGCPLDGWSAHKDFAHKSEWCEARRGFITRYLEPVTGARWMPRGEGAGAGP